jgi:hypothetical protein
VKHVVYRFLCQVRLKLKQSCQHFVTEFSFLSLFRFKSSGNKHIIEVKLEDSINMVCPHYPKETKESDMEFYIIYNVSMTKSDTMYHIVV